MNDFGVDLRGVIDLLSRHIYSGPEVYLRELLQNARDALVARAGDGDADPAWGVTIRPATADSPFIIRDAGIGLAADEVADLLSTVGRSSKRDVLDLRNADFLGHFGIGLLSCFMVADEIEIVSHKEGRLACVWRGLADGTYTVTELTEQQSDAIDVGTTVTLRPSHDGARLLGEESVRRLAIHYAQYLPIPVTLVTSTGEESLTGPAPFLSSDSQTLVAYGEEVIGHRPFDVIPLKVAATATYGAAYVLGAPASGRSQGAKVYLGRMLAAEAEQELVPDWAFFLRVVVSSDNLTPTASRESLVHDDALKVTRDAVADAVRQWVRRLAAADRPRLHAFLTTHDLAIRQACIEDDELFQIVGPFLVFETAAGPRTLEEIAGEGEAQYAGSLDEFRMLSGLGAGGTLVNASYVHHEELLNKATHLFADLEVSAADVMSRLVELAEPPLEDRPRTDPLAARASAALAVVDVDAVIKMLPDATVPSLYVADAQVLTRVDMQRASEIAAGPWANALKRAGERVDHARARTGVTAVRAQVCLNWASPLVQRLSTLNDTEVFERSVRLLYVQALLAGRRPLTERDRALMSQSLDDLITLSVGLDMGGEA